MALSCGGAAGFLGMALLGWNLAPGAGSSASSNPEASHGTGRASLANGSGRSSVATEAKRLMEAIRRAPSPEERLRATIALAQSLPASQIGIWLEQRLFDRNEGYELTVFNRILKERWRKEDPGGMALWLAKNESGGTGTMIAEWAAEDPRQVLEFLRDKAEPRFAYQALAAIAAKDPALAAKGLAELAARGGLARDGYYVNTLLDQLAKAAPGQLEQTLDALPTTMREQAQAALAKQRLATDFPGELAKLTGRDDGLKLLKSALRGNEKLSEGLVENLAGIPANWRHALASESYYLVSHQPEKWLSADLAGSGFSAEDAKRIQRTALLDLAREQPERGLEWIDKLGLTGESRTELLQSFFRNLRSNSDQRDKLPQILASLSAEDRAVGESLIAGAAQDRQPVKVPDQPADWLKEIAAMKQEDRQSDRYVSTMRQWSTGQVAEVARQFETLPAGQKTAVAQHLANHSFNADFVLQSKVLEHLAGVPADPGQSGRGRDVIGKVSEHAVRWMETDPVAAGNWVNGLPAGETKQWTQKNFAANWAKYDYDQAAQWVKSLPAAERSSVETHLKSKTTR